MTTLRELLAQCATNERGATERDERAEHVLKEPGDSTARWYLTGLTVIGAWLASLCLLGFFFVTLKLSDHPEDGTLFGLPMLVACIIVARRRPGLFVKQCVLAVSLAAQALLYCGLLPRSGDSWMVAIALSSGLAVVLYWLYPDGAHRTVTCLIALQVIHGWITWGDGSAGIHHGTLLDPQRELLTLYWMLHLGALAWCWMYAGRFSKIAAPLGYALALSLAVTQLCDGLEDWSRLEIHLDAFYYIVPGCMAAALIGALAWAAGGWETVRRNPRPFAGVAAASAAIIGLGAGAVLPALWLIVLGIFAEEWLLTLIGLVLLPIFLTHYYYNLDFDLLTKSAVLIGSGLILLVLRAGLRKWWHANLQEIS